MDTRLAAAGGMVATGMSGFQRLGSAATCHHAARMPPPVWRRLATTETESKEAHMGRKEETTIELEKVTYQRQGLVSEIATGFYGVLWTITHPGKTFLRGFGIVGGLSAVWFLLNFGAHLLAGSPGTAQAQGGDVGSWGRAAADTVRPVANNAANVVVGAEGYQTPVVVQTRQWRTDEEGQ